MTNRITLSALLLVLSALPATAQEATTGEAPAPDATLQAAPAPDGGYGVFGNVAVASLLGQDVAAPTGETVGEVERLVAADGGVMAVIGVGGFLGFGEHDVALPLTELTAEAGALKLQTLARADLDAMAPWDGTGEDLPRMTTVSGTPLDPSDGTPVSE